MKKKLFGLITAVLALGVIGTSAYSIAGVTSVEKVSAAGEERWGITGAFADGFNWDKDVYMVYNTNTKYYEANIYLAKDNTFKIRKDGAWTTSHGYGIAKIAGTDYASYTSGSSGNFKVKTAGLYKISYDATNKKVGMVLVQTDKTSVNEDSNEHWYIRGSSAALGSWGAGIKLNYDPVRDRYSAIVDVKANDTFKIVYNDNWDFGSFGYAKTNQNGCGTLWTGTTTEGDISFVKDGKFVVYVADDHVQQYGTKAYGFGVEEYDAEFVAKDIKYLAGNSWTNKVETKECSNNYAKAKTMLLNLPTTELNTFKTSEDAEIASARTTYEHWCYVNKDDSPYEGEVKGANVALSFVNDNYAYIIVFVAISVIAVVGLVLLKKKRALN